MMRKVFSLMLTLVSAAAFVPQAQAQRAYDVAQQVAGQVVQGYGIYRQSEDYRYGVRGNVEIYRQQADMYKSAYNSQMAMYNRQVEAQEYTTCISMGHSPAECRGNSATHNANTAAQPAAGPNAGLLHVNAEAPGFTVKIINSTDKVLKIGGPNGQTLQSVVNEGNAVLYTFPNMSREQVLSMGGIDVYDPASGCHARIQYWNVSSDGTYVDQITPGAIRGVFSNECGRLAKGGQYKKNEFDRPLETPSGWRHAN